jgi:hypothetical protein
MYYNLVWLIIINQPLIIINEIKKYKLRIENYKYNMQLKTFKENDVIH